MSTLSTYVNTGQHAIISHQECSRTGVMIVQKFLQESNHVSELIEMFNYHVMSHLSCMRYTHAHTCTYCTSSSQSYSPQQGYLIAGLLDSGVQKLICGKVHTVPNCVFGQLDPHSLVLFRCQKHFSPGLLHLGCHWHVSTVLMGAVVAWKYTSMNAGTVVPHSGCGKYFAQ